MGRIQKQKIGIFLSIALLTMGIGRVATALDYVPGEIIVKFKPEHFRSRIMMNQMMEAFGVEEVHHFSGALKHYDLWRLEKDQNVEQKLEELNRLDQVEYAQPNYILSVLPVADSEQEVDSIHANPAPFVPEFSQLFCAAVNLPCKLNGTLDDTIDDDNQLLPKPPLHSAPSEMIPPVADAKLSGLYGMTKIGAVEAWKTSRGTREMIVADIDTGIDYNHEDLSYNIWRNPNPTATQDTIGFDFVHNDALPYDDAKHGTHTAGTIGATGGNAVGVSGVNQMVSIMALKFIASNGSGTTGNAIKAIDYAIEHGARVLSNSWGGRKSPENKVLFDAIERAKAKGVLFIAAAGNDGADNDGASASYPAAFNNENLIAVAATDKNDAIAMFSNFGKKTTHLGAPGVKILSTVPGNAYEEMNGTSMACPHVAGAAALVWAKNPQLTYQQVKKIILDSVDLLPSLAGKTVTGGRLNVLKALRSMD